MGLGMLDQYHRYCLKWVPCCCWYIHCDMAGAVLRTLSTGSFIGQEVGKSCYAVLHVVKSPKAKSEVFQAIIEASTNGQECWRCVKLVFWIDN